MDRRKQIIVWAAMLGSILMYYVVMRVLKPAPAGGDVTAALALAVGSAALTGVSFLMKRRLASPVGFMVALAMCDAAAILGLISWFLTGSPLSYYPLVFGFAGVLLHYPATPASPE